jgi:tetratricopeptide (TPR) repeat protein
MLRALRPFSLIEAFARAHLGTTTAALGISEKLVLGPTTCEDEPPPVAEKCSMRTATVRRVQDRLAGHPWYAMYGGIGTGKTHLCVLLARQHTGRCIWLRLRDRAPTQALTIIDGTLGQIKPRQPGQTKVVWYQECCTALGEDAVLVLDDLPKTSGREEIDDTLVFLARAARAAKITLITASPLPLPPPTRAAVLDEVVEDQIPAFTEEEVLELLAAYGAPAPFLTEAWAGTVSAICRQHPLLLVEAARFLEARGWTIRAGTFQEVISGKYAINLDAPTQEDLVRTIPDPDTRELLYRLRIVVGSFRGEDVREVASLPNALDHPAERLMSLLGLWIQRDGHDRYVVSPLVSRLDASNLSKETERQVHGYLASRLVRERPMTALAATQAVFHYAAGELYENAGTLMLSGLLAYINATEPKDDFLLSELWSHNSLPTQMPVALRFSIRAGQIMIYLQKGKDASALIADAERLVASQSLPPELEGFKVLLGGMGGLALWSRRPADAVRLLTSSLCSLRRAPAQVIGVRSARIRRMYFEMLWSALSQVKTEPDLRASLDRLGDLKGEELLQWTEGKLADDGAETLCNGIWHSEHRKPESDRDWDKVLRMLAAIGDWALERSVMSLYAWSKWGTVVVMAEYLKCVDKAVSLGEQATAACANYPKGVFWLADIVGRQYYYAGRWKEALESLGRCVESPAKIRPEKRAYAIALAGINAAKLGSTSAKGLLTKAATISQDNAKDVPAALAASIQIELAFEQWRDGERAAAYESLSHSADLLLSVTEPSDDWKVAIVLLGNFAGFFAWLARDQSEDSWPYAKPAPGLVFDKNSSIVDLFDPAKLNAIPAQLTLLAECLGLHDEALRWAGRAGLADFHPGMHRLMSPYRIASYVSQGRFDEALEECWSAYAAGRSSSAADERDVQFSLHIAKFTAVTICFGVAALRVKDGIVEAERLSTHIQGQVRNLAAGEFDSFWAAVVEAMRHIAKGDCSWRTLYETGLDWENRQEMQLGIMYRLAAVINAPPREAFHLAMSSFRKQLIPWFGDTPYQTVVVPFLRTYWHWAFQQYSFHFSTPSRTARELEDALSAPGEPGLRKALEVIARSLGIAVTEKHRQYFSESAG